MKGRIFSIVAVAGVLFSCSQKRIVNKDEVNPFLQNQKIISGRVSKSLEEINFWKKRLSNDTGSAVDKLQLGWLYSGLFSSTGKVHYLDTADSLFRTCAEKEGNIEPDIYFSLAQNAITFHSFSEAYDHVQLAMKNGADKYIATLLAFDAGMELGKYGEAARHLMSLKDKDKFDYLVRKAKLEDHKGNLEKAIELMEQAFSKVKELNKPALYCWALSNLSDMYSHAGKIEKAYRGYLDVLNKDSSYLYALKGIAWIAYSHDGDTETARRVIDFILSQTNMPDLYLMLAEIDDYTGNKLSAEKNREKFLDKISASGFGAMYNKYLIEVYSDNAGTVDKAVEIAFEETQRRQTPETCSWLAWAYYKKGDVKNASVIYRNFVLHKTFEPGAMLYGGYIMKAAGETKLAKKLFSGCLGSSFELGPAAYAEVKAQLSSL